MFKETVEKNSWNVVVIFCSGGNACSQWALFGYFLIDAKAAFGGSFEMFIERYMSHNRSCYQKSWLKLKPVISAVIIKRIENNWQTDTQRVVRQHNQCELGFIYHPTSGHDRLVEEFIVFDFYNLMLSFLFKDGLLVATRGFMIISLPLLNSLVASMLLASLCSSGETNQAGGDALVLFNTKKHVAGVGFPPPSTSR